jgi:hypothetical protein
MRKFSTTENAYHNKIPVTAVVFFLPKAFVLFPTKPCDYSGQKATVLCVCIMDTIYIILSSETIQRVKRRKKSFPQLCFGVYIFQYYMVHILYGDLDLEHAAWSNQSSKRTLRQRQGG